MFNHLGSNAYLPWLLKSCLYFGCWHIWALGLETLIVKVWSMIVLATY